jgi:hypothetical protein
MKINKYRKQLIVSIIYVLLYKYIERPLINMYLEIHWWVINMWYIIFFFGGVGVKDDNKFPRWIF